MKLALIQSQIADPWEQGLLYALIESLSPLNVF